MVWLQTEHFLKPGRIVMHQSHQLAPCSNSYLLQLRVHAPAPRSLFPSLPGRVAEGHPHQRAGLPDSRAPVPARRVATNHVITSARAGPAELCPRASSTGSLNSRAPMTAGHGITALLVSYTVWSQWGRSKFRKGGVYHIPAEHESWEDIRENVLNYNEEGGGEHDQNAYDIHELKKPLRSIIPQPSLRDEDLLQKAQTCPKKVMCSTLTKGPQQKGLGAAIAFVPDFKEYVSQIIWEADNDSKYCPPDLLHIYCLEGHGSLAGSLSSLGSSSMDEDLNYDYLKEWGSKFDKLKELYDISDEHP